MKSHKPKRSEKTGKPFERGKASREIGKTRRTKKVVMKEKDEK